MYGVRHTQQQRLRLESPVSILKSVLLGSCEMAKLNGNILYFGTSDCADIIPNKYCQISFDTNINYLKYSYLVTCFGFSLKHHQVNITCVRNIILITKYYLLKRWLSNCHIVNIPCRKLVIIFQKTIPLSFTNFDQIPKQQVICIRAYVLQ